MDSTIQPPKNQMHPHKSVLIAASCNSWTRSKTQQGAKRDYLNRTNLVNKTCIFSQRSENVHANRFKMISYRGGYFQ